MGKSRNTEKSWQNAYVTEQRQPSGHVGGGQFTRGNINPATAAAQRNQAAIARHEALVSGTKPHSSSGGSASAGSTGSAGGGKTGSDAEDRAEAEEARDLIAQANAIERQIDQLNAELKAARGNIASAQAGAAPGAASGAAQSATAAAAAAAKPGAAAGSSTQTTAQYVASLQSKVSSLKEQIKDLKAKRRQLLKRARALLRDAKKASRPSATKGNRVAHVAEATKAATLTGDGELTYASFPITKFEETADGDILVIGTASDGSVDSDDQIVDPDWAQKGPGGFPDWFDSAGNVRVQHQAQRDPAGKGLKVEYDGDATVVKSIVVEPVAKELVRKGILTAYSVGIAHPQIARDPSGRARGGIIKGGQIVELSLVDRPANKNCGIQLVKAAKDGSPEWVGKVFGDEDVLAKAAGGTLTKAARPVKKVSVDLPANMSLSIKPSDIAKLATFGRKLAMEEAANKAAAATFTKAAVAQSVSAAPDAPAAVEKRDFDANVGGGVDRDKLPASDFVFPKTRDFPVVTAADVSDAVHSWGRYRGSESFATFKRRLTALAKRKGFSGELPAEWKAKGKKGAEKALVVTLAKGLAAGIITLEQANAARERGVTKAAEADVTKCGVCKGTGMADGKPCGSCKRGKRMAKRMAKKAASPQVAKKKKAKVMCRACGAKQNAMHEHCSECGKPLAGALPVEKNHRYNCLGCGKELDKGEKHCPGCGRENPGYLPEADHQIPANQKTGKPKTVKRAKRKKKKAREPFGGKQAPEFGNGGKDGDDKAATKAGKGRVVKKRKRNSGKPKGITPGEAGHVPGQHEKPAGPHREPDGAPVEAFEDDAHMQDGDHEPESHLDRLSGTGKAAKRARRKERKRSKGGEMPPEDQGSEVEKAAFGDDPQLQASLRLKTIGVPLHMGIAHDMACPAFLPAEVDLCYPGVSLKTLDLSSWQEDALEKAAGASMDEAQSVVALLEAITTLRAAGPSDIADIREGAYKMFRDVNPGPSHFPTPTQISPARFSRPLITAGHEAASPGHDAPHHVSLPEVGGVQPEDYTRGYISSGHADDSPANTHPEPPVPAHGQTGRPSRVLYRNSAREGDEHAMRVLHDHIAANFPALCPMHPHFASTPVPTPPGVPGVAPAPGPKKGKKKNKAAKAKARKSRKLLKNAPPPPAAAALDPAVLEQAVTKATAPLLEKIAEQGSAIRSQDKRLRKQAKALDTIAGQPDTSHAPMRGVALTKTSGSPAGAPMAVKSAEQMAADNYARLYHEWATTTDPQAQAALARVLAPYWNPAMQAGPHANPQA